MDHPTLPKWVFDDSAIEDPTGRGEAVVRFINYLQHPNSTAPDNRLVLPRFWERIIRRIYGPTDEDGERTVRQVFIMIPRGARKSSIAGALCLYHLLGRDALRKEGQIILAAGSKEQAGIAFGEARKLLETTDGGSLVVSKENKDGVAKILGGSSIKSANKAILNVKKDNGKADGRIISVQSADGDLSHGLTPSIAVYDELHIFKNRSLWTAVQTGLSKVKEPLQIVITTAGRGQTGLAWDEYTYAKKVATGEIVNPTYLPVLFEPPSLDADWLDKNLWALVNPGLEEGFPDVKGLSVDADKAKDSPADKDDFKQYHLNFWMAQSLSPFVEMSVYDECAGPVDLDAHANAKDKCWIGVDLGVSDDLCAVVLAWPYRNGMDLEYDIHPYFFCPEAKVEKRGNDESAKYKDWVETDRIIATPGNVTDYTVIRNHIVALCERFNVQDVAFDPAYAGTIVGDLQERGVPVSTMRQGWVTMAPAVRELERAIISRRLSHGGHPVLRWNFENAEVHTDGVGNRTLHKGHSKDKIDGAVASAMAVYRAFEETKGEQEATPFWAEDGFDPERALGIGDRDDDAMDAEAEAKMDAELREMLGLS